MLFAYLLLMLVLIYFMSVISFFAVSALKATISNENTTVMPVVDNNIYEGAFGPREDFTNAPRTPAKE